MSLMSNLQPALSALSIQEGMDIHYINTTEWNVDGIDVLLLLI